MKICVNCGTRNINSATVCENCGKPILVTSESTQPNEDKFQSQILERLESMDRHLSSLKAEIAHDPITRVVDFDMPFGSLVGFMVKASLASIPAFIILAIIFALLSALLASVGMALF